MEVIHHNVASKAEVAEVEVAVAANEVVVGLDITVHDASRVHELQAAEDGV
eukprot:CAMPEP_0170480810 /NCGR_PEP_ID=MMETSP0208-20121228/1497_1 /TAXON_ID=197538 /ORGANISM="Strombidium inclinatum, Strain S3" /LENGTH=50 /DNA_ID=CAMNT_0010753407 /DNA_START=770 /DNA_END=922 /DNA_ORIENTATION=+